MNQPTREEFDQLKEEQRRLEEENKEIKKRLEQIERHTEPIPATTRIEVASADVLNELKTLEKKQDEHFNQLKEGLDSFSKRQDEYDKGLFMHSKSIGALQKEMEGARADILNVRESQADLRDKIVVQTARLERIEGTMATKEDIKTMATKQDLEITVTRINADMTAMEMRIINAVAQMINKRPEE